MPPRTLTPGTFVPLGTFQPPGGLPERKVTAYVPHGAGKLSLRPALYMFDGQNVFGDEGSFSGGWHLDKAIDRLSPRTHHVPVVIAIDHGREHRISELSPWPVQQQRARADEFLAWVVETVIPAAQQALPLLRGPVGAAIGGSSMGGIGALYAHYRYPQHFGGALCMSSAFFVGGPRLFDFLADTPRPPISRLYVDAGVKEGGGRLVALSEKVVRALEQKGYHPGQLKWRKDPRGTHNERHWARRIRPALRFMFRR